MITKEKELEVAHRTIYFLNNATKEGITKEQIKDFEAFISDMNKQYNLNLTYKIK